LAIDFFRRISFRLRPGQSFLGTREGVNELPKSDCFSQTVAVDLSSTRAAVEQAEAAGRRRIRDVCDGGLACRGLAWTLCAFEAEMSDPESMAMDAAYDEYMLSLYEEHKVEAIQEFRVERLQSYFQKHPDVAEKPLRNVSTILRH
jgi:hypothetical protein